MNKYRPLVQSGKAAFFLPIVIGSDGTIHHTTALELSRAGVDLISFKLEIAHILLWHFSSTARAFASLTSSNQLPTKVKPQRPETLSTELVPTPIMRSQELSPSVEILSAPTSEPLKAAKAELLRLGVSSLPPRKHSTDRQSVEIIIPESSESETTFRRSRAPSPHWPDDPPSNTHMEVCSPTEPSRKVLPPFFKPNNQTSGPSHDGRPCIFIRQNTPIAKRVN